MIFQNSSNTITSPKQRRNQPSGAYRLRRKEPQPELALVLGNDTLHFKSVDDFSFAVESRTSIPCARFDDLQTLTAEQLWTEARSIKSTERMLVNILEEALCRGSDCGTGIENLGVDVFSEDHSWRRLMRALLKLGPAYEGYKRVALIKYMQYLGARQEIIRAVYSLRRGLTYDDRARPAPNQDAIWFGETLLFDTTADELSAQRFSDFRRLPRGETIKVHVLPGHPVTIRLATHSFILINDGGWVLYDPDGRAYVLHDGKNVVGRDRMNSVTTSKEYRNLSRRHLIAEPFDDHAVLITDLSSRGTYVPSPHIENITAQSQRTYS